MLLLDNGAENADVLSQMVNQAKINFVSKHHPYAITQIATGAKAGKWHTYVGNPRKGVIRRTKDALYEYLYNLYRSQEESNQTFQAVFDARMSYLEMELNRSSKTIIDYRSIYNRFVTNDFGAKKISSIDEADISGLIRSACRTQHPKQEQLKKLYQLINATFVFAIRRKNCLTNPAQYIDISCYYKDCDLSRKKGEQKEFSPKEIERLTSDADKNAGNPRALMSMMAAETGMRAGELAALHLSDIGEEYLHIHRQQLIDETRKGPDRFSEVLYTKDERMHPHDGRYFPINDRIRKIIALAAQIPGDSDYLFHDPGVSGPVSKDTYLRYLKRRCQKLGISATNNHAFRMALNSKFIAEGLNPAERALLLGHAVQTNEQHYSLTDKRQLQAINRKLNSGEENGPDKTERE